MDEQFSFPAWFITNWSRVALPAGIVILLSLPILLTVGNEHLTLVFALLPIYMLHQYEEHAHGRFLAWINAKVGHGQPVLTLVSIFWINISLVWALFLVVFALTRYVTDAVLFVPIYATLINAITHIGSALAMRQYNPGVVTSVVLFVPWSLLCLVVMSGISQAPVRDNIIGTIGGLLAHAVIVGYVLSRRRRFVARADSLHPG